MFWVPKPLINYFEMTLHVGITFKVGLSHKVCFNHLWIISEWSCMQVLHLGLGFHSKAPSKLHIGYFEATQHVGIAFKVGLSFKVLLKSPMGYFEMNLAITFRVRVSYNFTISTHVLTFTNWKFGFNFLNN